MKVSRILKFYLIGGLFIFLCLSSCLPLPYSPTVSPSNTASSPDAVSPSPEGNREERGGWIHVQISGGPFERGFEHGSLLSKEIRENILVQDRVLLGKTGRDFQFFKEKAMEFFSQKIPPEFQEEMRGIAEGARAKGEEVSYEDILTLNGLIDLTTWIEVRSGVSQNSGDHCSAFIAIGDWTEDGGIVMAHNTWWGYAQFYPWHLILDIQPSTGFRFVMQSAPGLIWSGSDFFISASGIIGSETTFFNFKKFDEKGVPTFVRVRNAMQYADSIEEFADLLNQGNNGGYPNAWLLGDIIKGRIARFEQGLEYTDLKIRENGYFSGYNAPEDPRIQGECGGWSADDPSNFSGARKIRFEELMEEYRGRINAEVAMKILGDHWDTWLQVEKPSSRTICGHYTFQGEPSGAVDGKVTTGEMARDLHFYAIWGLPCQTPVDSSELLKKEEFRWLEGFLHDLPEGSWSLF
ncbi:MAG: phospholipase B family protein [Caldiserica bacterium]|jgi:hypothetical protein|nr:phospholipase B family protein [Caldisericota bacterium]MDH7562234.1 C45 family autoproteolytic acyltransferase/hydrolase [Caldisericota bacterium]